MTVNNQTENNVRRARGSAREIAHLLRTCDRPVSLSVLMDDGADALDELRILLEATREAQMKECRSFPPCRDDCECYAQVVRESEYE